MKNQKLSGFRVLMWFAVLPAFISCSDVAPPDAEDKSEMVMATDSELALLMRQLTSETENIKAAIEAGEEHPLWSRMRELHSATPTDSTSAGPVFEGFASAFIGSVEEMQAADTSKTRYFNAVIDRCMDCHATYCPGPMKRIEKFYVEK